MSSSGVFLSSSNKHVSEKLCNKTACDASTTTVMVFKEVRESSDDDDSSKSDKRGPGYKLGPKKKMKLSEKSTIGTAESLDCFCKIHKRTRQLSENRPLTSDMGKVFKPYLQPTVNRGLKGPQRPMTAGKLSDIAARKYTDSIFKVYVSGENRVIKKKRVVPITNVKPMTPTRSPILSPCRVPNASEDIPQKPARPESDPQTPRQLTSVHKPSSPPEISQPERNASKTARKFPETATTSSPASPHVPAKTTPIPDLSLTKEQEVKRLSERLTMRKRTMDSVKKIFPTQSLDDGNWDSKAGSENDLEEHGAKISGDENTSLQKTNVMSRNSLKTSKSDGVALISKRSVTWSDEFVTAPGTKRTARKVSPKRQNSNDHTYKIEDNRKNDSNNKSRASSASEASNSKVSTETLSPTNKREKLSPKQKLGTTRCFKANTESTSEKSANSFSKRKDRYKRNNIQERRTYERAENLNDNSTDSENSKFKFTSRSRGYCSGESVWKRRILKVQRNKKNKRCTFCNAPDVRRSDMVNKPTLKESQQTRNRSNTVDYNRRSKIRKEIRNKNDTKFHYKRNAIISKHHLRDVSEDVDESGTCNRSISKRGSRTSYDEEANVRRGQSTPSVVVKTTYEDYVFGSSDSKLRTQAGSRKDVFDRQNLKGKVSSTDYIDKPLKKIFGTFTIPTKGHSEGSDKLIRKADSENRLEREQNVELDEIELRNEQTMDIHDIKNGENPSKEMNNSKSMESLNYRALEIFRRCGNQSVNQKPSTCELTRAHEQLDKSFLMVESYNVLTEVGNIKMSDSKIIESSNSTQLVREQPMLNIPFEEIAAKSDEQLPNAKEINNYLPDPANKVFDKSEISNLSCLKYNQKITHSHKVVAKAHVENQSEQKPRSKILSNHLYSSPRTSHEKIISHVVLPPINNISIEKTQRTPKFSTFKPRTASSDEGRSSHSNGNMLKNIQSSADDKNFITKKPKSLEDRKTHLRVMLSKGESSGVSRATERIKEKWNSTQNAITVRKEKMLASIRVSREAEKTNVSETTTSRKLASNKDSSAGTKRLCLAESPPQQGSDIAYNDTKELTNDITDSGIGEDSFEMDYFQDAIVTPGAREPQLYSSNDLINVSFADETSLEQTLACYPTDDIPEKPLCESDESESGPKQMKCDLSVDATKEHYLSSAEYTVEDVPEKDVNSNVTKAIPLGPPLSPTNEYVNDTSNSPLENNSVLVSDQNISYMFSPVRRLSVEAVPPEDNVAIIGTDSLALNRNACTANNTDPRKVLSKSRIFNNKSSRSTNPSISRDRSLSRRSKASSSGSSRRSVKLLERPPSRKPHMTGSSDDDSEQDFISVQPSPMNINADPTKYCYKKFIDSHKKHPPSRMYSTLKDTPHSVQESIKTAIKDLHGIKDENCAGNERPSLNGQRVILNENDNLSSRMSRKSVHMPRMSPGSVRILQNKRTYVPPASPDLNVKKACGFIVANREACPNECIRSTRKQKYPDDKRRPVSDRRSTGSGNRHSSVSPISNIKPPFRNYSNINKNEDAWTSPKLKNLTARRIIPNYLPPWERVNLTPPESALQERALHEKKLGSANRSQIGSPNHDELQKPARSSNPGSPLESKSPRPLTPMSRTPVGKRTCLGIGSPVENRNTTPNSTKARTPLGVRRSELNKPPGSPRPITKPLLEVPLVNHELLENSSHGDSDEWKTADNYEEDSSPFNLIANEHIEEELYSGGSSPSLEDSSTLLQKIEKDKRFISSLGAMSCSSLDNVSCTCDDESLSLSDYVGDPSCSDFCSLCQESKKRRRKSIALTLSKTSVSSRFSLSLSL